jgi:hypothetical protein
MDTKEKEVKKTSKKQKVKEVVVPENTHSAESDTEEIRLILADMRKSDEKVTKEKQVYADLEKKALTIAKRNPQWFKDDKGNEIYTKSIGMAKLVLKSPTTKYEFADQSSKEGIKMIFAFLRENPEAYKITAVHSKMEGVDLTKYGITKTVGERKLEISEV